MHGRVIVNFSIAGAVLAVALTACKRNPEITQLPAIPSPATTAERLAFAQCTGAPETPAYVSPLADASADSKWRRAVDAEVSRSTGGVCAKVARVAPDDKVQAAIPIGRLTAPDVLQTLMAALHIDPDEECYARAHLVASRLGSLPVSHAKIFAVGDVYNPRTKEPWTYHVAVVVPAIDDGGTENLRVLDPALKGGPVFTLGDWLAAVTASRPAKEAAPIVAIEIADRGQLYPSITARGSNPQNPPSTDFRDNCEIAKKAQKFSLFGAGQTTWKFNSFGLDCAAAASGYCIILPPEKRAGRQEEFAVSTNMWPREMLEGWASREIRVRVSVTRKEQLAAAESAGLSGMVTAIMPHGTEAACTDY